MRSLFRATVPVPTLAVDVGDIVVDDPALASPMMVLKALPVTPGELAALRLSGALVPMEAPVGLRPALRVVQPTMGARRDLPGFQERLRHLLQERGLTQQQLAAQLGVGQGTVSWWTRGGLPRTHRFAALADALGVSVDYLVMGTGPGPVPSLRLLD